MKVNLIAYTKDAEKLITSAGKLCYSSISIDQIMEKLDDEQVSQFITMLSNLGHGSAIEHATFTFGIEGISRACLAQITRHRIASYNVQSQRYVKENKLQYITPPEIEQSQHLKEIYDSTMNNIHNIYLKISDELKQKHYQIFLKQGFNKKSAAYKAEKLAIEDARFLLPNACSTKLIVTMNARNLKHFFSLRCCNRSQWEIRNLACEMLKLVKKVAPNLFFDAGPNCIRGVCKEGKMSCGQMKLVRKYFLKNEE